eukprot:2752428-Rhodomonas_salina.2
MGTCAADGDLKVLDFRSYVSVACYKSSLHTKQSLLLTRLLFCTTRYKDSGEKATREADHVLRGAGTHFTTIYQ